jgi:hypothetical protein
VFGSFANFKLFICTLNEIIPINIEYHLVVSKIKIYDLTKIQKQLRSGLLRFLVPTRYEHLTRNNFFIVDFIDKQHFNASQLKLFRRLLPDICNSGSLLPLKNT